MNDLNNGSGGIYVTADGGTTWTQQTPAAFSGPYGYGDLIYFWNANEGLAVGDSNGGYWEIYTTSNGGGTWTRVAQNNIPANLPNEYGQDGVFDVNGNTIWFVTNKGRVYKSTDKGMTWTVSQTGMSDALMIAFKDASNGLVSDASGSNLYKTNDGGTTWSNVAFNGNLWDYGMCYMPGAPGAYFTTGYGGSSYSLDGGLNWVTIDSLDHTVVKFNATNVGWSGGWNASSTVGGMYKWMGALGIDDALNKNNVVKIFPDPMTDAAFVVMPDNVKNATVILYDAQGKEVKSWSGISVSRFVIRKEDLVPGIYFFRVQDENGLVGNGKLMVQ
jgi:photosystem II stability/assembly factor-like uncharacterized protein